MEKGHDLHVVKVSVNLVGKRVFTVRGHKEDQMHTDTRDCKLLLDPCETGDPDAMASRFFRRERSRKHINMISYALASAQTLYWGRRRWNLQKLDYKPEGIK